MAMAAQLGTHIGPYLFPRTYSHKRDVGSSDERVLLCSGLYSVHKQCNIDYHEIMTWQKNGGAFPSKLLRRGQMHNQALNFSTSERVQLTSKLFSERQRSLLVIPLHAVNEDSTDITPSIVNLQQEAPQVDETLSSQLPTVFQAVSALKPVSASYDHWSSVTEQLAASATVAFLLLQLPQIILNTQNLMAGNNAALFAVPWMGLLTGLLGNLSLLSYFAGKKETGAMFVQAVGVLSTFLVQVQLAIAGAMPAPAFIATAIAVGFGYLLNFLNYKNLLSSGLWRLWQDAITIGGVSVLPQVMWSTFDPYLLPSLLPGMLALATVSVLVLLIFWLETKHGSVPPTDWGDSPEASDRMQKLPKKMARFMGGLAAWSATLLFMWGPVTQMWTNIVNPSNIQGLSVLTVLLAMIGNSLLLPRALFTRDLMWFTGSLWGALLQGWGILLTMYIYNCISYSMFLGVSFVLALWLVGMLVLDSKAYSLPSPANPLVELFSGSRQT